MFDQPMTDDEATEVMDLLESKIIAAKPDYDAAQAAYQSGAWDRVALVKHHRVTKGYESAVAMLDGLKRDYPGAERKRRQRAALADVQSGKAAPTDAQAGKADELTPADLAAAQRIGVSPTDYLKFKAQMTGGR